ncbi:hypothetical protein HQ533_01430 [Candidatus Woesearchaeota archaeon]|nr:hypothetical protein [Candidatus Woesearchaeota archaeon]
MKKGIFGFKGITNLILVALSIFVVVSAMTKVLAPYLGSETRTPSYENFQLLASAVDGLVSLKSQSAIGSIILEIEPGYVIIGFEHDKDKANYFHTELDKPKDEKLCGNEACICLFKVESKKYGKIKKVVDCVKTSKARFYSRSLTYKKMGCGREDERNLCYSTEHGIPVCTTVAQKTYFVGNKEFADRQLCFLGKHFPGYDEDDEVIWSTQEMLIQVKTSPNDEKEVFIDLKTEDNLLRYKFINICPTESDTRCIGRHYDYVFTENIVGEDKTFACKFDYQKNKCINENIEECPIGPISEKCACGETAYEFGFCIKENNVLRHKNKELPEGYCFGNKIDACEKYKTDNDYESDKYACTFNICGVAEIGCYWDTKGALVGGLKKDACETCPAPCNCNNLYDEEWIKEANPCGCECNPPAAQSTNLLPITDPTVMPPYI